MKISNSKKQLAKIISDNGGWFDGANWAIQGRQTMGVGFSKSKPYRKGDGWFVNNEKRLHHFATNSVLPNWHQTILSRDEYFHLYPAPDADGWIAHDGSAMPVSAWMTIDFINSSGGGCYVKASEIDWGDVEKYRKSTHDETSVSATPTIEQLTSDYRAKLAIAQQAQDEADSHRFEAEAALEKLYQAGLAIGLDIAIADDEQSEPGDPLNITDWRDLRVGDVVFVEKNNTQLPSGEYEIQDLADGDEVQPFMIRWDGKVWWPNIKNRVWRFIRRP